MMLLFALSCRGGKKTSAPVISGPLPQNSLCQNGFELVWKDDFSTFNPSRWETATHTFDGNRARFAESQVSVEEGFLKLRMKKIAEELQKPYLSGEVRTIESVLYGRVEARAKFAKGSGLVSSLFLFYDQPDFETRWNEIDVEYLGHEEQALQYNTIINTSQNTHEKFIGDLEFKPADDFHTYSIEWVPNEVRFFIDGTLRYAAIGAAAEGLTQPQKIMMNLWPSENVKWAGVLDWASVESSAIATYDYVSYSRCR